MDLAAEEGAAKIQRFKQQITEEWQNPAIVAAYRKWSAEEAAWGEEAGRRIVERAQVEPGMGVLDLASGALARAVGPRATLPPPTSGRACSISQGSAPNGKACTTSPSASPMLTNCPSPTAASIASPAAWEPCTSPTPARLPRGPSGVEAGGSCHLPGVGAARAAHLRRLAGNAAALRPAPGARPRCAFYLQVRPARNLSAALEAAGFHDVEEESVTIPTSIPVSPARYWEWFAHMAPRSGRSSKV